MSRVGDIDNQGYVCRYIKGPIAIWESPGGEYGIYLTVMDEDFVGTLYNHRGSYEKALLIADKTYRKLTVYGRSVLK